MVDTMRNPHQLLKGKKLYSTLCGERREVLLELTAILREGTAKQGRQQPRPALPYLQSIRNFMSIEIKVGTFRLC
jgi:hypothetical protein